MEISFDRTKQIVKDEKEAQYGQFVDLGIVLERLKETNDSMNGEEAILRFLYELAKRW